MPVGSISRIHPEYQPTPERIFHPRQLALFTNTPDPIPLKMYREPVEGEELLVDEGLLIIKNEGSSQLMISSIGVYLGQKNERLTVKKENNIIYEFPLCKINEILISSKGVSICSDLIAELCHRGTRLSFLSDTGKPYAIVTSPLLTATTITRREQIMAFVDKRGVELIKIILSGKLRNQEKMLSSFNKQFKPQNRKRAEKVQELSQSIKALREKVKKVEGQKIDEVRNSLTDFEESGNKIYWEGVKELIIQKFEFLGQVQHGAIDMVNSLLNYGYGILYSQIWGAALQAGLEPFAGFLHIDQPGKTSLVLDLVEEFRQPVVDWTVITQVKFGDVNRIQNGLLDAEARKFIGGKILQRLESGETYEGKKYRIKSIIQMQARHLASFLRGEGKYRPFPFKW